MKLRLKFGMLKWEDGFQKQTMVEFQQCFQNHGMVLASKMKLNMHLQIKQLV